LEAADAILVSGDLTDTAAASEWKGFFDAFTGYEELFAKMVVVPGNHDVNLCDRIKSDDLDYTQRKINSIRFVSALDRIQGDRSTKNLTGNQASGPCLR
jgi:hypothetical protein